MSEPKFKRGDKVRLRLPDSPLLIINMAFQGAGGFGMNEFDADNKISYNCLYIDDDEEIHSMGGLSEEILELDE